MLWETLLQCGVFVCLGKSVPKHWRVSTWIIIAPKDSAHGNAFSEPWSSFHKGQLFFQQYTSVSVV